MSRVHKTFPALLLLLGFVMTSSSCRSGGETTRLDFSYQKPVWTDASPEQLAELRR